MSNDKPNSGAIRFDLQERSTYRFWLLVTQMQKCLAQFYVARIGRPANGWKIMMVVGRRARVSAAEAGQLTDLEPDKVTRIVDRLVAQGLMIRTQESADRRRVRLSLTTVGRRVYHQLDDVRRAIEIDFLGALAPRERATLYRLLDKLQARAAAMFSGQRPWAKYEMKAQLEPGRADLRDSSGGDLDARTGSGEF
jgi:DNA-binding MarR family transcriptional regulator